MGLKITISLIKFFFFKIPLSTEIKKSAPPLIGELYEDGYLLNQCQII